MTVEQMVKRRRPSIIEKNAKESSETSSTNASSELKDEKTEKAVEVVQPDPDCCGSSEKVDLNSETSTKAAGGQDSDPEPCVRPTLQPKIQPMATRSSTRPKRPRRDSPPPSPPKKAKVEPVSTPETKRRRQWEQWSILDKDMFFEALCEHGKDFEAIQATIAAKYKKKGDGSVVKSKEQIRHFYYRTWHKINKYITGVDDPKNKHVLELYGLVNYGELRRRVGPVLDEKKGAKLNELIVEGSTVVKFRGKNHRIRTPLCKSLKKLNNMEDPKDGEGIKKIPDRVTLELRPKDNATWKRIQELSQNPRLRVTLNTSRRLSSVIEFLNKKWRPIRVQIKEGMDVKEDLKEEVKLRPLDGCHLRPFHVRQIPIPTASTFNFNMFLQNQKNLEEWNLANSSPPMKKSRITKESKAEQAAKQVAQEKAASDSKMTKLLNLDVTDLQCAKEVIPNILAAVAKDSEAAMENKDALPKDNKDVSKSVITGIQIASKPVPPGGVNTEPVQEERHENLEQYRNGWTMANADNITLGELYLLLEGPENLIFEYEFVQVSPSAMEIGQLSQKLTNMLRRLVHIATTEFSDFSKPKSVILASSNSPTHKCACGNSFKSTPPSKNNSKSQRVGNTQVGKAPSTSKTAKLAVPTLKTPRQGTATPSLVKVPDNGETSNTSDDNLFRIPTQAAPRLQPQIIKMPPVTMEDRSFLQQLESLNRARPDIFLGPKRRRVNRNVRKPLVVQRTLLPKVNIPARRVMAMNLGPAGSFMPVSPNQLLPQGAQAILNSSSVGSQPDANPTRSLGTAVIGYISKPVTTTSLSSSSGTTTTIVGHLPVISEASSCPPVSTINVVTTTTAAATLPVSQPLVMSSSHLDISPAVVAVSQESNGPNITSLLDISLPGFLDGDSNSKSEDPNLSSAANHEGITFSPSKIMKSSNNPELSWLGGEDFNLSNFIDHSPVKKPQENSMSLSVPSLELSRDSAQLDVDNAVQCMMNENSVDYVRKFADLAAQISSQELAASQLSAPHTYLSPESVME